MDWPNEVTLEFLNLYENESIIWNPKHPYYKNRNEVGDAWRRIQESISVECTVQDLKRKKESLMAAFRPLYCKVRESIRSGASPSEVYKPNWFAYETMKRFLNGIYQPRSTITAEEMDDSIQEDFEEEVEHPREVSDKQNGGRENAKNENSGSMSPNQSEITFKFPKKRKLGVSTDDVERRVRQAEDNCSLYGDLLARKLRGLNEKTREVVMNDIDNLVFRAKMNQNYQPSHNQPVPACTVGYPSVAHSCSHPRMHAYTQPLPHVCINVSPSCPQCSEGHSSCARLSSSPQPSPSPSSHIP